MVFQLMFAIITPALISGAFAERMKFSAYIVFALVWTTLVYDPGRALGLGRGRLAARARRASTSRAARSCTSRRASRRSCAVLIIGSRTGCGREPMVPHSLPMTVTGAGLLWFGWFGFNAGSALGAGRLAPQRVRRHATPRPRRRRSTWMLTEWRVRGKPTVLGVGSRRGRRPRRDHAGVRLRVAAVGARRSARSPACVCFGACHLKGSSRLRRLARRVGVHGVGRLLGALLTGVFASTAVNPAGADGLLAGNAALLGEAGAGRGRAAALRGDADGRHPQGHRRDDRPARAREDEAKGLDLSQHAESRTPARASIGCSTTWVGRTAGLSRRRRSRRPSPASNRLAGRLSGGGHRFEVALVASKAVVSARTISVFVGERPREALSVPRPFTERHRFDKVGCSR